jgi:hypothetical protein
MEKKMKTFLAFAFAITLPNLAYAEVSCNGGSSDIFKFIKWDVKTIDNERKELTLKVHNATDQNFKDSQIKIRWGEYHRLFFKFKILAKADSDTVFMNSFPMPTRDAEALQAVTPTLCTVETNDESDHKKLYE